MRRRMYIIYTLLLVLALLPAPVMPAAEAPAKAGGPTGDVILDTMRQELDHSMKALTEKVTPPPYYISYRITENQHFTVAASFGALSGERDDRTRLLDIDMRVGDHRLDNTHRMRGRDLNFAPYRASAITIEDDAGALKDTLWLETDRKYKAAAEKLIQIKANLGVSVEEEDKSDDFSKEEPARYLEPPHKVSPVQGLWKRRVKEYSALFNGYPYIYQVNVRIQAESVNKYFADSEGTMLRHGRTQWQLWIYARTKADDGMNLYKLKTFTAPRPDRLPEDKVIRRTIQGMIDDLMKLRTAPVMEPYTGPAILSGEAGAVFFHEIFGHRIEGHRQKNEEFAQTFTKKVNQAILPDFISVVDDPTLKNFDGKDLNGFYLYDDEGVKSRRITVVDKGILKDFLMSRSPIKGFARSNGHGRAQAGLLPVSRQGNLVISASNRVSEKKLRRMLIKRCKEAGKPYGLYFGEVTGGFTFTGRFTPQAFNVNPIMVYRVYTDGRPDELVRGVDLIGTPLTSFSKIFACGKNFGVFNGYCGAESGRVPVSAVCPTLLTEQIEVQKSSKASDKPPVLPPPGDTDSNERRKK